MITAATSSVVLPARRLRNWLSLRHTVRTEAFTVLCLYDVYELARSVVVGDAAEAQRHAGQLVALEQSLHLLVETNVQDFARALPGLTGLLGVAYLTLHLGATSALLLWIHQRRPAVFPFVRTTLLLASGIALVGSWCIRRRRRGWTGSASPIPSRAVT